MTTESLITILISGVFAAFISVIHTSCIESRKRNQALRSQSLSLISTMEEFAVACAKYVSDVEEYLENARRGGKLNQSSYPRRPIFSLPLNIDFAEINTSISCEILTLPVLAKQIELSALDEAKYNSAVDAYEVSSADHADLGFRVLQLSYSLRRNACLPEAKHLADWDFLKALQPKGN